MATCDEEYEYNWDVYDIIEHATLVVREEWIDCSINADHCDCFRIRGASIEGLDLNMESELAKIGNVSWIEINLAKASVPGEKFHKIFGVTCECFNLYVSLFKFGTSQFKPIVLKMLGYDKTPNHILLVDSLEILPEYRKKGVTQKVLKALLNQFWHNHGVLAVSISPLQVSYANNEEDHGDSNFCKMMGYDDMSTDYDVVRKKLVRHFKKMGLKKAPKLDFMISDFSDELNF